jgi:transcription-repair coupling factor (superfamily II helicase)
MIQNVFSQELIDLIKANHTTNIDNVDKDLVELLAAGILALEKRHLIWIVGESENMREKEEKLKLWLRFLGIKESNIRFYLKPFEDPYINNDSDFNAIAHKVKLVSDLVEQKQLIVLTTRSTLSIKIEKEEKLGDFFLTLTVGQSTNRDDLTGKFISMGYRARNIVEERGDIAWRGSIVDVFPLDNNHPVRIEIEDDQVISLRRFDPDTQKSVERIKTLLFPMARFFLDYETNLDYFSDDKKDMICLPHLLKEYRIIGSDRIKINDEFNKLMSNYEKIYEAVREKEKSKKFLLKPQTLFHFPLDRENILSINETYDTIDSEMEWVKVKHSILDFNQEDIGTIKDKIENDGYRLFVFSKKEKLAESLEEYFGDFNYSGEEIPFSFENNKTACLFLTRRDFQLLERVEVVGKYRELNSENLVKEIKINDLVVHQKHGIGQFVGFKKLGFEDNVTEFLKIAYVNNEFLYVPVYELDVLSKYVSSEGYTPPLDKLGGSSWRLKQKKAKKSIITFARDLLQLYALRKAIKGCSFKRDYELEERLAQEFQYVETEDQKRAIRDVLNDLEAEFPMDRLICGDVSFGKTEVAIRAAFRVVTGGKQVALLCPTTILAYQHYVTFKSRLASFPVTIAMLSRMVPTKEKKTIHEGLAGGRIDIVIGTHSLISKELKFKRLGLYIIDEEQRFGVFQKEKLKKNREEIDALSLSATPIPRTLSLSMAGLQDISTIQTPPIGRVAVKNYVGWFSKEIVISAVLKEIERDGLVFIVYNNIDKIYTFQEQLHHWLPDAASVVIHARMKSETIEKNLMAFINKKYRVLISTTIIENGIDIPDVNTLVILGADRFGLTQLYQLRGRIGRGNRQAYAYFLVESRHLPAKARFRLEAIREFADLGSGYKLAEFDLELRGAGSLLGNKQHGHIEALGFDYYHRLLYETIKELKGEIEKEKEARIKINFSYSIEPEYIRNSSERIIAYRRILEAKDFEQLDELRMELNDRYGRLPQSMEKIFFAGMIRVLAKKCQFEDVEVSQGKVAIRFPENSTGESLVKKSFFEKFNSKNFEMEILDNRTGVFYFDDYRQFIDRFRNICQSS